MSIALVPLFPSDADVINDIELRPRVQNMHRARAFANLARHFTEGLTLAIRPVIDAFNAFGAALARVGAIPPDPTMLKHGAVWTSPLDGTQFRVRGRRGRPRTFHWGRP